MQDLTANLSKNFPVLEFLNSEQKVQLERKASIYRYQLGQLLWSEETPGIQLLDVGSPTGDFHPMSSRPCWAYTTALHRNVETLLVELQRLSTSGERDCYRSRKVGRLRWFDALSPFW
jgi:hypothetical protein